MSDLTTVRRSENPVATFLLSMAHSLRDRFLRFRRYRQTLNELESLSDRELADLGLARGNLRHISWHAVQDQI